MTNRNHPQVVSSWAKLQSKPTHSQLIHYFNALIEQYQAQNLDEHDVAHYVLDTMALKINDQHDDDLEELHSDASRLEPAIGVLMNPIAYRKNWQQFFNDLQKYIKKGV